VAYEVTRGNLIAVIRGGMHLFRRWVLLEAGYTPFEVRGVVGNN
jgi:hypothetical protein